MDASVMGASDERPILLTGATGYVGGRLLKALEARGCLMRCIARRPEFLQHRVAESTQVVEGDLLDKQSLRKAMKGVQTAYYLVHSMAAGGHFEKMDRDAARNFADTARESKTRRIIYLGGLGEDSPRISPHLRSRHEVGRILRDSGAQVIEFRAAVIIGSGSLSFEMIRALVERLPVMITPRWVSVPTQPIAVSDVLDYLLSALEASFEDSRIYEIGGTDQVSYGGLMREYARQRGLRRLMIPVPLLTPRLSSLWLGLVTPLYARVGRVLIDSIRYPTLVRDNSALDVFPVYPKGIKESVSNALQSEAQEFAETRWSDAWSWAQVSQAQSNVRFGTLIIDSRAAQVDVPVETVFHVMERIGGSTGWYYANWLWQLRGILDLLNGGVGMRRGRRDPEHLRVGDVVDFWRVEALESPRLLRLFAEMKLPGRAWLQFEAKEENGRSVLCQTAIFDPVGQSGLAYWNLLWPIHKLVFAGMLRGMVAECAREKERNT